LPIAHWAVHNQTHFDSSVLCVKMVQWSIFSFRILRYSYIYVHSKEVKKIMCTGPQNKKQGLVLK